MAVQRIIIETSRRIDGYLAEVVVGPAWAKRVGCSSGHETARSAYLEARTAVMQDDAATSLPVVDTFEFIHAAL